MIQPYGSRTIVRFAFQILQRTGSQTACIIDCQQTLFLSIKDFEACASGNSHSVASARVRFGLARKIDGRKKAKRYCSQSKQHDQTDDLLYLYGSERKLRVSIELSFFRQQTKATQTNISLHNCMSPQLVKTSLEEATFKTFNLIPYSNP